EVHDQCAQAIAVCDDDHAPAAPNDRGDYVPIVGQKSADCVFQTLGQWNLRSAETRVARIIAGVTRVIEGKCGWTDVEAAAPELDLLDTMFCGRLRLVE